MTTKTVNILLVEDDEVDAEAMQIAFHARRIANPITHVVDGIEALNTLRGDGGLSEIPRPFLIILDLNLPRMDGHEFLEELRKDAELSSSIVFVLTTSEDEGEKAAVYNQHVAGYMVKSNVGDDFIRLTNMLDCYWRVVEFPPEIH